MRRIEKHEKVFFVNDKRDDFWKTVEQGVWERETYCLLDQFLDSRHSYIDIGSWVGPTVLYAAQLARHSYAIEPDPIAFQELQENVFLNPSLEGRLTLYQGCISSLSGKATIGSRRGFGDTLSSLVITDGMKTIDVPSLTLEDFVAAQRINDCNFIKLDIEGGEVYVLPSAKDYFSRHKPTIYVSLHPFHFPNVELDARSICDVLSAYKELYLHNGCPISPQDLFKKLLLMKPIAVIATE